MILSNLFRGTPLSSLLDIFLVWFLIYRTLVLLQGTRAFQVLLGLVAVAGGLLALSTVFELTTLSWILNNVSGYLALGLIILFQGDIRRALAGMGRFFGDSGPRSNPQDFETIARACFRLADQGKGALIVMEQGASLDHILSQGTPLDARLSEDLLVAIFQTTSPIHDGAVVISHGRIAAGGCFLRLSADPRVSRSWGTRHRAAMGHSEEFDSLVFVVSEERGSVGLFYQGEFRLAESPDHLRRIGSEMLQGDREEADELPGMEPITNARIPVPPAAEAVTSTGEFTVQGDRPEGVDELLRGLARQDALAAAGAVSRDSDIVSSADLSALDSSEADE